MGFNYSFGYQPNNSIGHTDYLSGSLLGEFKYIALVIKTRHIVYKLTAYGSKGVSLSLQGMDQLIIGII